MTLPWWAIMASKIVLSRLPIPYRAWKRVGLFEHGKLVSPDRAIDAFLEFSRAGGKLSQQDSGRPHLDAHAAHFGFLELGPGDSLGSAVIARALGATRCWLVDVGDFAQGAISPYRALLEELVARSYRVPPEAKHVTSVAQILDACRAAYLTDGIRSLRAIPSGAVDFGYSNAVLEHVATEELGTLALELHRVMRSGGTAVHRVDLQDHLGGGLNNLRFSHRFWESSLVRGSGFYTNRLRCFQIVETFRDAGFQCDVVREVRWSEPPLVRARLDSAFRAIPDDELGILGFDLLLRRP
jgi:SAM-dependent methyltransferase